MVIRYRHNLWGKCKILPGRFKKDAKFQENSQLDFPSFTEMLHTVPVLFHALCPSGECNSLIMQHVVAYLPVNRLDRLSHALVSF